MSVNRSGSHSAIPMHTGKRVAILVHGGVEQEGAGVHVPFLVQLIQGLSMTNDITVYTFRSRAGSMPTQELERPAIHFVAKKPVASIALKYLLLAWHVWLDHRRMPFDLLHGIWLHPSGILSVALAKLLGIPAIVSLHGAETADVPAIRYGHFRPGALRRLVLWACGNADRVTLLSKQQKTTLEMAGIQRKDLVVVPPSCDPGCFRFIEKPFSSGPLRLLHVANLTPVKDQKTLLRAFQHIRKALPSRLTIIGGDYADGSIQALAGGMGLAEDISFSGYVAYARMPDCYAQADILISSSLHEAGGIAVTEAMSSGVVVCGTSVGLIDDLKDSAVVAVPVGDPIALASAVIALLHTPGRYHELQATARRWVVKHSLDASVDIFRELYLSAIRTRKRRPIQRAMPVSADRREA